MTVFGMRASTGKENGQGLVEFALTVPIALAIVFVIIELGFAFNAYVTVVYAAKQGARAGAVYLYQDSDPSYTQTVNDYNREDGDQRSMTIARYTENIRDTVASSLGILNNTSFDKGSMATPGDIAVTYTPQGSTWFPSRDPRGGDLVNVAVNYRYHWLTPFFSNVPITMKGQASARIEQ